MIPARAAALTNSWPKAPAASVVLGSFDPCASTGRRSYSFNGSSANPNYTDVPGWSWPGNPWSGIAFKVQARLTSDRMEGGINGATPGTHFYAMRIGGVIVWTVAVAIGDSNTIDTGYFDVSDGASGAVDFLDWTDDGAGGTAFTGTIEVDYRYVTIRQ